MRQDLCLSAAVYPFLMMMMTAPSRRMRTTRPPAHTPRIRPISSECCDTSNALRWSLQAAKRRNTWRTFQQYNTATEHKGMRLNYARDSSLRFLPNKFSNAYTVCPKSCWGYFTYIDGSLCASVWILDSNTTLEFLLIIFSITKQLQSSKWIVTIPKVTLQDREDMLRMKRFAAHCSSMHSILQMLFLILCSTSIEFVDFYSTQNCI